MPRKSRKNVGLIGLGIIGARAAAGLRAAGYQVFVWNRTPKPAPNFLGSPAEIAEICDVIQLFVADAHAVREVIEMCGDALSDRHTIVCSATIGPEATKQIADGLRGRGVQFLDAPFTGSKMAAEKAQLSYYVGGDEAVYQRVRPMLEATSRSILRCGGIGDAATLKVATNLITATTTQILAESLAIVRKAGIAAETLGLALEQNACRSGVIDLKLPKMIAGDYEPHFSLKHMFKDVQLGIHMANALGLEVPVTTVTAGVMFGALNHGWADLDFASLYKVYADGVQEPPPMALPPAAMPVHTAPPVVEAQFTEGKPSLPQLPPIASAKAGEPDKNASAAEAPKIVDAKPKPEEPEPKVESIADLAKAAQEASKAGIPGEGPKSSGSGPKTESLVEIFKPAESPAKTPAPETAKPADTLPKVEPILQGAASLVPMAKAEPIAGPAKSEETTPKTEPAAETAKPAEPPKPAPSSVKPAKADPKFSDDMPPSIFVKKTAQIAKEAYLELVKDGPVGNAKVAAAEPVKDAGGASPAPVRDEAPKKAAPKTDASPISPVVPVVPVVASVIPASTPPVQGNPAPGKPAAVPVPAEITSASTTPSVAASTPAAPSSPVAEAAASATPGQKVESTNGDEAVKFRPMQRLRRFFGSSPR